MTTVIAIETKEGAIFAADTQVTTGGSRSVNSFEKFFANGPVVFGLAGRVRVANILQFLEIPALPNKARPVDIDRWVITELIPTIGAALKNNGSVPIVDNEIDIESNIILAVNGTRLYSLGRDFSIGREKSGVYAIGSGSAYALGAIEAGVDIYDALKIACSFDIYSGGKIIVKNAKDMI